MMPPDTSTAHSADSSGDFIETATQFLGSIFEEPDLVLFRPIETWTEEDRKHSRVDYKNVCYRRATRTALSFTIKELLERAAEGHLNLFFGVCPRVAGRGEFDLAWQIRVVRVLWADIDHVTVDAARERLRQSGLPPPSVLVNSGNGVHGYWLLDEPWLIDDVGPPPPVLTEWTVLPGGRKRSQKYILENDERLYLDKHRHAEQLSPKAQLIQNVLAGIATAVGGDHTTDLSRLLRIPGSLNRKNERNGASPVPCDLVEMESTRRYPLEAFLPFAKPAPETQRIAKIAAMPLPRARKPSLAKGDKLAELIAASAIAPAGTRSEADFAACCFAIRHGFEKESVWSSVEEVGKFAESGRPYFDRTWENAEFEVRATIYDGLTAEKPGRPHLALPDIESPETAEDTTPADSTRPVIHINPAVTPVAITLRKITACLFGAGDCFLRCEQLVVVQQESISAILTPSEFAALLNQHVEFYYLEGKKGEYRPLTPAYANTWLNHRVERARLPEIKLYTRNPVYTQDWKIAGPGLDRESGIYYAGPTVMPRDGTECLDRLLQDFCFKSPSDRTNYIAILLTIVLIARFVGAKPAALFNGNQPGLGKSMLAQVIAILRDGRRTETASYNPNDEELEKRLGAIVRRGASTIIIDNAKGHGRQVLIESACLERSITDAVLSFRLLGKSQEIRAENSHIFVITANTPNVSPDLISRSVVINLEYEGDPKRRIFQVADPEHYAEIHRAELLGELLGMVERWKAAGSPLSTACTRFNKRGWGETVGGILQVNGEPDFLTNAEEAASQLDETRRDFEELVSLMADNLRGNWTPTELVDYCSTQGLLTDTVTGGSPRSKATRMGTLAKRFVDEEFDLLDGRKVQFRRGQDRKGYLYQVVALEVPNPTASAEPLPNLAFEEVRHS